MSKQSISMILVLSACITTVQARAQETRTEQMDQEKAAKAASVQPEEREKGDTIITKLERVFAPQPPAMRLTSGDFRPGAGLAAGLAYAAPVRGGLWTTKAAWSIKNFKQGESTFDLRPMAGDRLRMSTFVRWNDAPDLTFFGLGNPSSPADEVSYGLRSTEVGAEFEARAIRWFRYGGSVAYFSTHSGQGAGAERPIGAVFTNESAPGLGSRPAWVHSSAYAAIDTRESPGYTSHGALYRVGFHHCADRSGRFSFDRANVDLRQFFPVLHNNWVIALEGRADMTRSAHRGR